LVPLAAALGSWSVPQVAHAQAGPPPVCQSVLLPVTVEGVPGARLYGELCVPPGEWPGAVQLLVHGATYNHYYSDWPEDPSTYSYVRQAVEAGYATFDVDRVGYGRSTHPASTLVTLARSAEALHDVITQLRSGAIGRGAFSRVIWVGHSLGTLYAWVESSLYQDVDAFVLTGLLHSVKPSWLQEVTSDVYSASHDPKFAGAGLDDGYLTTRPWTRGSLFYYAPTADPLVILLDELLKDTVPAMEFGEAVPLFNSPPPATAPSLAIRVPTLLVVGEHDAVMCDQPDGLDCTTANVTDQETPYYAPEAQLEVYTAPNTGHDLQLHTTAPLTGDHILRWLANRP
jgi:pimeloyl-ACP methyl ester carboxylesterase